MPIRTKIIDVNDHKAFRTIHDAINWCVGSDYKDWENACWPNDNPDDGFRMWFTQLAHKEDGEYVPSVNNSLNFICCNGNYHVFEKINPQEPDSREPHKWKYDLIFSKEFGDYYYFRGVFVKDFEHSSKSHHVSKRIATKVKLIGCPARRLILLNSVDKVDFDENYLKTHIILSKPIQQETTQEQLTKQNTTNRQEHSTKQNIPDSNDFIINLGNILSDKFEAKKHNKKPQILITYNGYGFAVIDLNKTTYNLYAIDGLFTLIGIQQFGHNINKSYKIMHIPYNDTSTLEKLIEYVNKDPSFVELNAIYKSIKDYSINNSNTSTDSTPAIDEKVAISDEENVDNKMNSTPIIDEKVTISNEEKADNVNDKINNSNISTDSAPAIDENIATSNEEKNDNVDYKIEIIKYDPSNSNITWNKNSSYKPLFTIINKKLYRTNNWNELFQILLFSYCYKTDNMDRINHDLKTGNTFVNAKRLIVKGLDESSSAVKFAPDICVKILSPTSADCEALEKIQYYAGKLVEVHIIKYDRHADKSIIEETGNAYIDEYIDQCRINAGSTKHLIAHINGKVLSDKEKFYRKIEKEFDRTTLIGDIEINEAEECLLKNYMFDALKTVAFENGVILHPKIFAFGLVRLALKHYESNTFWPFFKQEYGINIPGNYQWQINEKFQDIMQENSKLYDVNDTGYIHNICMHAFVCNKYANRFFDYMFDFWRLDLSRSIENCIDDNGNNLFEILIEEISQGHQDIKLHTSTALKMNPKGCKNRFRRILRMIDNSYWNDADYSGSNNRITTLFNKWKNDPKSSYFKEISKNISSRKHGRGEKLLSRPTIEFSPADNAFRLLLPKQVLRGCTEEETPYWTIKICGVQKEIEAKLLFGKAFLFTDEMAIPFNKDHLFDEIEIKLCSERRMYYRRVIKSDDIRFFNSRFKNIDSYDDSISKDVSYILTKKGCHIDYINGTFSVTDTSRDDFDVYLLEPSVGDILILPNNHALSFGQPLIEGLISEHKILGVTAELGSKEYRVTNHPEKLFFKTTKQKLNGTSIKVLYSSEQTHFGKAIDNNLLEFKLDEITEDVYGYILSLDNYIKKDGAYSIQLSIPGCAIREYNICYINAFSYSFKGAPYLFKDSGIIEFSKYATFKTNSDWLIEADRKSLEFWFDESERELNKYVKNRKLNLEYLFSSYSVNMIFDLPVLYWKFDVDGVWYTQKPEDVMIKTLPKKIYINGDLNLQNSKMLIESLGDLDDAEISANYDKESSCYYFRTIDIVAFLNRQQLYRNLQIRINDHEETFLRIVCRSDVRSQSISGDFRNKKIFGYFDIFGDSEYMVTIKRGDKIIEEDIPLKDGKFEINCNVEEGFYTVNLYELEDDDSGFGSVSYKLGEYSLEIIDERNFNGKDLTIKYIRNRNRLLSDLPLNGTYVIANLRKADFDKDIGEGKIYSWLYDSYDSETLRSFEYYFGWLGNINKFDRFSLISDVVVIIDNDQNINEVLVNMVSDGSYEGLKYFPKRGSLILYESNLTKSGRKMVKMIDDDLYQIGVEIGGKK